MSVNATSNTPQKPPTQTQGDTPEKPKVAKGVKKVERKFYKMSGGIIRHLSAGEALEMKRTTPNHCWEEVDEKQVSANIKKGVWKWGKKELERIEKE